MAIIDNEFEIADPNPLENLNAFLMIGNAQNYLDEHYKEATKSIPRRIGAFVLANLNDLSKYAAIVRPYGF
ncbi:MAG: hypothetical protein ACREF7_01290 [Candidatus Saccharimonadales bacterium]